MRKSKSIFAMALLAAILAIPAAQGLAYFTTYATAKGGYPVKLDWETELDEEVDGNIKTVKIDNTGDVDCYVRIRAYSGTLTELSCSGDKWLDGKDGWYYYAGLLPAHSSTREFVITITPDKDGERADYDVIVVHESAPPAYDENGELLPSNDPAIWSRELTTEEA